MAHMQAVPVSQRTLRDGSVRFEQVIWVPNENVRPIACAVSRAATRDWLYGLHDDPLPAPHQDSL